MNLVNQKIESLTFEDIVSFCKVGHPEGIQLDYKRELIDSEKLGKTVAALANSRGGVIIFGVIEDRESGLPITYDGFECDAKTVGSIEQMIANIDPLPEFEIRLTNEVNHKRFIVLRIFEGFRTPYYVFNDANVWVRTGAIKKPIEIASPDYLELLFGKKEKAEKLRFLYHKEANDNFQSAALRSSTSLDLVGWYVPLSIATQPFFPNKSFVTPSEIKEKFNFLIKDNFRVHNLPERISSGIMNCEVSRNFTNCLQFFSYGMFFFLDNLFYQPQIGSGIIDMKHLIYNVIRYFKTALKFYEFLEYQGGLIIKIKLENLNKVKIDTGLSFTDLKTPLRNQYDWDFKCEVRSLSDIQVFIPDLLEKISWSLDVSLDLEEFNTSWEKVN